MAAERTAEQIQSDIEHARVALAGTVDQLAYRTNPRRVADNAKSAIVAKAQTPQGKAVIAGVGALVAVLLIRKIAKR